MNDETHHVSKEVFGRVHAMMEDRVRDLEAATSKTKSFMLVALALIILSQVGIALVINWATRR